MSQCKVCGAEIAWLRMESGKMMPVNLDAEVIEDKGEKIVVCKPHWASCPEVDRFRQRSGGKLTRKRYGDG
jgi:hypothetical protein